MRFGSVNPRLQYRKRVNRPVIAVQLALDTPGFTYNKWGATQTCQAGDWIVNNDGDVYTVDGATFARTYREISPGVFEKATSVWAEVADTAGSIATQEGQTAYLTGDYLVFNEPDGGDGYAVAKEKFEEMYEQIT